jgi:tRNA-specific 2-thiouridylase
VFLLVVILKFKLKYNFNCKMNKKNKKVAVGMSGGVDSSLAAALLKNVGYEVIGLTMAVYNGEPVSGTGGGHACYGPGEDDDLLITKQVCDFLGIEHFTVDLKEEYKKNVLDHFKNEYSCGRTPNPCTRCNPMLKFGKMLQKAKKSGINFDYFATGHYVRTGYDQNKERYLLKRGSFIPKDQSYFLYGLNSKQLKDLIFPLGSFSKEEVRKMAKDLNLPVSMRQESQDFIEGGSYAGLFPEDKKIPGNIIDVMGNKLGTHKGIINFTIGQRKGIGIAASEPLYVVDIDSKNNNIVAGSKELLYADTLVARDLNYVSMETPDKPLNVQAKIRQNHSPQDAKLIPLEGGGAKIVFNTPQMSITKGQSVVFYDEDIVLGGGVIDEVLKHE